VRADKAGPIWIQILDKSSAFRIGAFDVLAAVEAAAMTAAALNAGDEKSGLKDWTKIKFDRQIIAIARVAGSRCIYSHDPHFKTLVGPQGPQVITLDDLPLPPKGAQMLIPFHEENKGDGEED